MIQFLKELWCEMRTGHYGPLDESGAWFTCGGCGKGVPL